MTTKKLGHPQKGFAYIIIVLTILLQRTHSQSYLLTLGQSHRNFISEDNSHETFLNPPLVARLNYSNTPNLKLNSHEQFEDNNTTIIVIKSLHEEPNELSETAMDVITIVWYVATFLALAAFFMLMACSDRRCGDAQRNGNTNSNDNTTMSPPTPSPSYSEFAPPSYDSVIKAQHLPKPSVFVIPFASLDGAEQKDVNNSNLNSGNVHTPTTPTTPAINFYIVNEVQKSGS